MRNPARLGRKDANHKAIAEAIRLLGFPVMDLSAAGNGVEDLLVGLSKKKATFHPIPQFNFWWIVVECKVSRNKSGTVQASQWKPAQKAWREQTAGWPRIVATSAQDAVDQIRGMTE